MFDNLLMSMNSKLKKIMSGLETNEGKIDGISTSVSNTYTKADYAASNTATNNTANKTGVLSAKLAYIISLLENTTYGLSALKNASSSSGGLTSCVRKIQRGTISVTPGGTGSATLSGFTDLSKMSVRLEGNALEYSDDYCHAVLSYVSDLTTTKLTITAKAFLNDSYGGWKKKTGTISYEVIEFY